MHTSTDATIPAQEESSQSASNSADAHDDHNATQDVTRVETVVDSHSEIHQERLWPEDSEFDGYKTQDATQVEAAVDSHSENYHDRLWSDDPEHDDDDKLFEIKVVSRNMRKKARYSKAGRAAPMKDASVHPELDVQSEADAEIRGGNRSNAESKETTFGEGEKRETGRERARKKRMERKAKEKEEREAREAAEEKARREYKERYGKDKEEVEREMLQNKPSWAIQKEALKKKFPDGWMPRKRLSPDAISGIRALNQQFPSLYSTAMLARKFEVSPEAIRRILRTRWEPKSEAEEADRHRRWFKRGVAIWERYAELGLKPPRKWRDAGIEKNSGGETGDFWGMGEQARETANEELDEEKARRLQVQNRLAKNLM